MSRILIIATALGLIACVPSQLRLGSNLSLTADPSHRDSDPNFNGAISTRATATPASSNPVGQDVTPCRVKVTFSGAPRTVSVSELGRLTGELSYRADWSVNGWSFENQNTSELVMCACKNRALTDPEVVTFTDSFRRALGGRGSSFSMASLGRVYDFQALKQSDGIEERTRLLSPSAADSCLVVLTVRELTSGSLSTFLSRVDPLNKTTPDAELLNALAERFRQLEQLLRDKLISQDEYEAARKRILNRF